MAETNAAPAEAQLLEYRSDLADYLPTGKTLGDVASVALTEVKRYLEDRRSIKWTTVYDTTGDAYIQDADGNDRNKDRIQKAIILMTCAILFRDYSIVHGGSWWELYLAFRMDAENTIKDAALDIDLDESGAITDEETALRGQTFMVR